MSAPATLAAPDPGVPDRSIRRHVLRTLQLAGPVILSRVGVIFMLTVDVIVLGRAGPDPLADYILGQALFDSLTAALVGLLLGVPVLTARETGRGAEATVGRIWWRGLAYALLIGVVLCIVLQFSETLFRLTGQSAEMAARGAAVTGVLAFAMPFTALYLVSLMFLEALHRPLVGMVAILIANCINPVLNIVFVFGYGPIPAMGAQGCALATAIVSAGLAVGLSLYVRFSLPERRRYGLDRPIRDLWRAASEQRRIGYAAGASYLLEATAFLAMTMIIGTLGVMALATHGVLFQFLALTFMVSYGLAAATQVRVGNAWGRGDPVGMRYAGWTGLGLSVLASAVASVVFVLVPEPLIRLFTNDAAVAGLVLPVMGWMALALIFDGGQAVVNQACRGRGDTWVPTSLHLVSYWLLMIPMAILFAYGFDQGVAGAYQGIVVASIFSLGVLVWRFAWLCRHAPVGDGAVKAV